MTKEYRGTKEYAFIYTELITAAKYRGTVTYQEVAKLIGLPLVGNLMGSRIGLLLGEISEDEVIQGRPMLSAIVVNTQGVPGPGFYALAKQLGKIKDGDDEKKFWQAERLSVYDTWKVVLKLIPSTLVSRDLVIDKTEGVRVLVQDVLATFSEPYDEDIILNVCVKIESNPEWRRRYEELSEELRDWVVNNSIGQFVKAETGLRTLGIGSAKGKCKIIKSYTKLGYND